MPIKILSVDTFATTGAPVDDIQLVQLGALPAGTDASGGTMTGGTSPDGQTLTYTAADGTQTQVPAGLAEGVFFAQGDGVPVGVDLDEFLMVTTMNDPETGFPVAGLAVAGLDDTGTPTLTEISGLLDAVPGDGVVEYLNLTPLGNGQIVALAETFDENSGAFRTVTGLIGQDGTDFNFSVLADLDERGATSPSDTLVAQLPDGGTVIVTGIVSNEDGAMSFELTQLDPAGDVIASQTLTEGQVRGLDKTVDSFGFEASITAEGELKLSLLDRGLDNIDTAQTTAVVFDLLPEQSDAPGIVLEEEPGGKNIYRYDGDNVLRGGQYEDYIDAGNGDDLVYGKGDDDYLIGASGWDTIYGGDGSDYIDADGGFDSLYGGDGNDLIYGGAGKDYLNGGNGNDFMSGGAWHDVMRGGAGQDEMSGGLGNDDLNGGRGGDFVRGDQGNDKVSGYDGDDTLFGGDGTDKLHGGRDNDILYGGAGEDSLHGSSGDDTLYGDEGDDTLNGGFGEDVFGYDLYAPQDVDVIDLDDEGPGGDVLFLSEPELKDNGSDLIAGFEVGTDKILIDGTFLVADPEDPLATQTTSELTFDDIFLSQEDSVAVIQAGETEIRLKSVRIEELGEDDFILI